MTVKYLYNVLSSDTTIHMRDASGGHMDSIYYGNVAEARSTRLISNIVQYWKSNVCFLLLLHYHSK